MLVLDDADLDRAVEGAVRLLRPSGQLCISIERMYVADAIYDRFIPTFLHAVRTTTMGPSYDGSTDGLPDRHRAARRHHRARRQRGRRRGNRWRAGRPDPTSGRTSSSPPASPT